MSMIDVSNLTFGYEGSPELIFDHVGFQIDSGWKLGFTGRNGRGKTTFLRLLQGEYPYSGTISASVEFEYFPYEVANLSRTGLEVVREIAPAGSHTCQFRGGSRPPVLPWLPAQR